VKCGYGISIVIHETLHSNSNKIICDSSGFLGAQSCTTAEERFAQLSAKDGVTFASDIKKDKSAVTTGDDFLLYNQYATNSTEGFAISGAAYVLAPEKLKANQPDVYNFYKDKVFEGKEYVEILNGDCKTTHIEIKNDATLQQQVLARRKC
jgi:hypothetical protein